jgi:hypothetical protein
VRTMLRLFVIVGTASLITGGIYFGVILAFLPLLQRPNPPRMMQVIMLPVVALTPAGVAAWWMFRRLRARYPPRTARVTAIVFAVFTPVSLGAALPLSLLVGAYSEGFAGYTAFGLVGAIVGIVMIIALLGLVPCAVALWVTRRHRGIHQTT